MQALQQFVNQSPWDPLPVRRRIAERLSHVVWPEVWVIDDVSFPKCGRASVGVGRQYCGAVGQRTYCQVAVCVHAAIDTASCPLEWQLYLPREWTDGSDRCRRAGEVRHGSDVNAGSRGQRTSDRTSGGPRPVGRCGLGSSDLC
ncbi:DDE superfamily endonuclease [Streptomyces sp. BK205]|nr:DDE superfamily endonuclease [Streptomyces sp. BK205]